VDYVVVIHPAEEGGYWAEVPLLPGCYAQGESIDETLTDVREAIVSHIEALREFGEDVPQGELIISTVRVDEPATT
jgi:predicted RNase H-like HicB family nuclease